MPHMPRGLAKGIDLLATQIFSKNGSHVFLDIFDARECLQQDQIETLFANSCRTENLTSDSGWGKQAT